MQQLFLARISQDYVVWHMMNKLRSVLLEILHVSFNVFCYFFFFAQLYLNLHSCYDESSRAYHQNMMHCCFCVCFGTNVVGFSFQYNSTILCIATICPLDIRMRNCVRHNCLAQLVPGCFHSYFMPSFWLGCKSVYIEI